MAVSAANILERLDQEDKEKVSYFIRLLLNKSKHQQLKQEVAIDAGLPALPSGPERGDNGFIKMN